MNKYAVIFVIISLVCLQLVLGCDKAYAGDPLRKLGRGITNVLTGWLEIPKEIGKEVDLGNDIGGLVMAPIKGFAKFIGRTSVGVYDTATFIIPCPRGYEPVIEPELVFETWAAN